MRNSYQGLVLIELLLSLAIIGLLFGLSLSFFELVPNRSQVDAAVRSASALLVRAEILSRTVEDDATWGVRFEPEAAILFKGDSYDTRDAAFDEVFDMRVTVDGTDEYVFSKVSGRPTAGETSFARENVRRTISVNAYGTIEQ